MDKIILSKMKSKENTTIDIIQKIKLSNVIRKMAKIPEIHIIKHILEYIDCGLDIFYVPRVQSHQLKLNPYNPKYFDIKHLYTDKISIRHDKQHFAFGKISFYFCYSVITIRTKIGEEQIISFSNIVENIMENNVKKLKPTRKITFRYFLNKV